MKKALRCHTIPILAIHELCERDRGAIAFVVQHAPEEEETVTGHPAGIT